MIGFNPDGSIKLPEKLARHKAGVDDKMRNSRCITLRKEVVSTRAPKSCVLHIALSEKFSDSAFVQNIYDHFCQASEVPTKLVRLGDREFKVDIGTSFRRCSDCTSLIHRYRNFLEGNIIEQQGNCDYSQGRQSRFCYEDYFD